MPTARKGKRRTKEYINCPNSFAHLELNKLKRQGDADLDNAKRKNQARKKGQMDQVLGLVMVMTQRWKKNQDKKVQCK